MPKMYALRTIIRVKDDLEETVKPRTVFSTTVPEAKQYLALKSARNARADEIRAAEEAEAKADGSFYETDATSTNDGSAEPLTEQTSIANDPKAAPKGKAT